jgi:hypothetical protein
MLNDNTSNIDSKLNLFEFDGMDIFIPQKDNLPRERHEVSELRSIIFPYLNDSNYNQLIEDNARKRHLSDIGVLYAQGDIYGHNKQYNKIWVFDDSDELRKVQDWITAHDGKYSLLMLFCYAKLPPDFRILSKKSSILLPDDSYLKSNMSNIVQSKLYVPRLGLIKKDLDYQSSEIRERA